METRTKKQLAIILAILGACALAGLIIGLLAAGRSGQKPRAGPGLMARVDGRQPGESGWPRIERIGNTGFAGTFDDGTIWAITWVLHRQPDLTPYMRRVRYEPHGPWHDEIGRIWIELEDIYGVRYYCPLDGMDLYAATGLFTLSLFNPAPSGMGKCESPLKDDFYQPYNVELDSPRWVKVYISGDGDQDKYYLEWRAGEPYVHDTWRSP